MADEHINEDAVEEPTTEEQTDEELENQEEVHEEGEESPSKINPWLLIGSFGLLVIGVGALIGALIFTGVIGQGNFVKLDAANPSTMHPDGIAVALGEGVSSANVALESIPRETFLNGEGGRQWSAAHAALPSTFDQLSPLYIIKMRGEGELVAEMAVPNGADPLERLDLYRWDKESVQWVFQPSSIDRARQVIIFQASSNPTAVIAVHTQPQQPEVGLIIPDGSTASGQYGIAILKGLHITEVGALEGTPAEGTAATTLLMVENRQGAFSSYDTPDQRSRVITQLIDRLGAYDGVVLDFAPGVAYPQFLGELAEQIHRHGKRLEIVIRDQDEAAFLIDAAPYLDRVWVSPGDNPVVYLSDGEAASTLDAIVGAVSRQKVGLMVSAYSVDIGDGVINSISTADAMHLFGDPQIIEGYIDPKTPIPSGSEVPIRLSSKVASMGFDEALAMNYLTYYADPQQVRYVYFSSAKNLHMKLSWAQDYGLGAVAIAGIIHPDASPSAVEGLNAFLSQSEVAANPEPIAIEWRVQSEAGAELSREQGDLTLIQYLWKAVAEPGQYIISAVVKNPEGENPRGEVVLEVGELPTPTGPTLTPTAPPQPTIDPNVTPQAQPTPTPQPPTGGVLPGSFELGGQTHSLSHPNEMHYAGMTWVKYQHKWSPGDDPAGALAGRISQAHASGFKVLFSVPGPLNPSSIDYDAYVNFLAGAAALGPDGLEVWNEMNFSREWPKGQISGANYVNNMLAPAYTAIKAANPNVMVISGAPTPTGAFGGCGSIGDLEGCDDWFYLGQMRDAGAANYMDCMGIHYNSGATSPTVSEGHPADGGDHHYTWYFQPMVNLYYGTIGKPLCFTEIGYVSSEGYGPLPGNWGWGSSTTVAQQAQWLSEAAVLSSQGGKVRLMVIFNVDIFDYGADPQGGYAIIRPNGTCPACELLNSVMP